MKKQLLITMTAMLPMISMASIPTAERPIYRALQACEAAVETQLAGAVEVKEAYRQRRDDGTQVIFANVLADDSAMRVTCTTTGFGNRILAVESQQGRWVTAESKRI